MVRGPEPRPEGRRVPPHLGGVRAGVGVRRDPQQLRFPAPHLLQVGLDAGGHHDPWILVARHRARCTPSTTPGTFYVAISDADRHPALDYVRTIHHGIDIGAFRFNPAPHSYVAFFGRIHPDKGVVAAIEAAKRAGVPLRIAGIIQDEEYFEKEVVPLLDGNRVQFVGPVRAEDRSSFLGGAQALLHLVNFDEPFGLSVVEAMACGTPVIAFDRGSMREIHRLGNDRTLVADVASAAEAIKTISRFDRATVARSRGRAIQPRSNGRPIRRGLPPGNRRGGRRPSCRTANGGAHLVGPDVDGAE